MEATRKFVGVLCWVAVAWAIGFNLMGVIYIYARPFFN